MGVIVHIPFGDKMHQNNPEMSRALYKRCLLNPEWWARRAAIMRGYVIPALRAQRTDVRVLATFRTETMPIAVPVLRELRSINAEIVTDSRDGALLAMRPEHDIVVAHLDSDDAYHPDALAEMEEACDREGAVAILREGYYLDLNDGRMAEVSMAGPPFFSVCYTPESLSSPAALTEYRARWCRKYHHEYHTAPRATVVSGRRFVQTIHGTNTTSTWENPHTKNKIQRFVEDEAERDAVLADFRLPTKGRPHAAQ